MATGNLSFEIEKAARRVTYYVQGLLRDLAPHALHAPQLAAARRMAQAHGADADLVFRVNYYNKLAAGVPHPITLMPRPHVRSGSRYYYDLMEALHAFPAPLRPRYQFGDVIAVPDQPTILKSRPIAGDNQNSVLLKLDRFRHYQLYRDRLSFDEKRPMAVWRGGGNLPWRQRLIARHATNPRCDIGSVSASPGGPPPKPYLSPFQQLGYKYILSIEGNDVATNLKWIMASNSLCFMPPPRYETWFMEGTLKPGIHYVELQADYDDLDEKIEYFNRHPDEARTIIANAQAYVRQFFNPRRERLIALLVLQKYFERTGQAEPWPQSASLFT